MLSPRFALAAVVALLSLSSLSEGARLHHRRRAFALARRQTSNGSGDVQNSAVASSIQANATKLVGNYYLQNVATSKYLYWSMPPQTIIAEADSLDSSCVMTLSTWDIGTRVHPQASDGKCLAAQFNSDMGVDWAGTMYKCATDATPNVGGGNSKAKQQWHFVQTGDSDTFSIIPQDHLEDMETRALSSASLTTAGGYQSTQIALYDPTDPNQMWVVTQA